MNGSIDVAQAFAPYLHFTCHSSSRWLLHFKRSGGALPAASDRWIFNSGDMAEDAGAAAAALPAGAPVVVPAVPAVADVLLRSEDIAAVRATAPSINQLHIEARNLLNTIIQHGGAGVVQLNGAFTWLRWRQYVAMHPKATMLVGPGIVDVMAMFIDGTQDPNRNYQERLDFVLCYDNGNYWRLHPGQTRRKDAIPCFVVRRGDL